MGKLFKRPSYPFFENEIRKVNSFQNLETILGQGGFEMAEIYLAGG